MENAASGSLPDALRGACLWADDANGNCQPSTSCAGLLTAQGSTCPTAGARTTPPLTQDAATVIIGLSGTFSATVQFEGSADGGVTWVAVNATSPNSTTAVTSATGTGAWRLVASGLTHTRTQCSSYSSGEGERSLQT